MALSLGRRLYRSEKFSFAESEDTFTWPDKGMTTNKLMSFWNGNLATCTGRRNDAVVKQRLCQEFKCRGDSTVKNTAHALLDFWLFCFHDTACVQLLERKPPKYTFGCLFCDSTYTQITLGSLISTREHTKYQKSYN